MYSTQRGQWSVANFQTRNLASTSERPARSLRNRTGGLFNLCGGERGAGGAANATDGGQRAAAAKNAPAGIQKMGSPGAGGATSGPQPFALVARENPSRAVLPQSRCRTVRGAGRILAFAPSSPRIRKPGRKQASDRALHLRERHASVASGRTQQLGRSGLSPDGKCPENFRQNWGQDRSTIDRSQCHRMLDIRHLQRHRHRSVSTSRHRLTF
jgi:hypothetical protein